MARPCKPASILTDKSQTKAEIEERDKAEKNLRGKSVKLTPPKDLTAEQKKIFRKIVAVMKDSDVLGSLDVYLLRLAAVCIDRMQTIEQMVNQNPGLMLNNALMSTKDKYVKDYFRCCNELGLSPQSRAKLANISATKTEDPLADILKAMQDTDD